MDTLPISAINRLLSVSEILSLIAEEAAEDRRSLVALAQTCHSFCSPALDVLWRSQSGLVNILNCMPADLWETSYVQVDVYRYIAIYEPRRRLIPNDLKRFNIYASRIRVLHLGLRSAVDASLSSTLWHQLANMSPSALLFPNLREWHCHELATRPGIIPGHQLVLGTHLTALTMTWASMDRAIISLFLADLSQTCRNIRSFRLHVKCGFTVGSPSDQQDWIRPGVFDALTELRTVEIDAAMTPIAAFTELASLPHLVDMVLRDARFPVWPIEPEALPTILPFRALRKLKLAGSPANRCAGVLAATQFPVLEELEIQARTIGALGEIFQIIHDHCSHSSLRILRIIRTRSTYEAGEIGATSGDFRHLHVFRRLEELSLEILNNIMLTDEDLTDMALAWPQLTTLWLVHRDDHESPFFMTPAGTLLGLTHFARHCPRLVSISIALDTSNANAIEIMEAFPEGLGLQRASPLTHMLVGDCMPVGDPAEIAMSLVVMFPNLWELAGGYPHLGCDGWGVVEQVLPHCRHEAWRLKRRSATPLHWYQTLEAIINEHK